MTVRLKRFRREPTDKPILSPGEENSVEVAEGPTVEIPKHDPFHAYLLQEGRPVDPASVELDSPALDALKEVSVELVVPLISRGELIGTLNMGHRRSDQSYSTDDRSLLESLATQVAPAIRVAQLVRQQEEEAKKRERIDQELRVAALIQQTLLPKELPALEGWDIEARYRPARAVGGDFYDFIPLRDGLIGLVVGDVTDKGIPAALVMATCRSMLRAAAERHDDPGRVLEAVNNTIQPEIPPAMFVTCFYGVLDPTSGDLIFANAGHNLPYLNTLSGVSELRATGMPLGLMPDMSYEVHSTTLHPGDTILLSSDGIAEAHDPNGEMFGLPRLIGLVGGHRDGRELIDGVLAELDRFTGTTEQEDDVTMVALRRVLSVSASDKTLVDLESGETEPVDAFTVPSVEGNERTVMKRVSEIAARLGMPDERRQRLGTAVAETTMNAIEHGNHYRAELPVEIEVHAVPGSLLVRIRDDGGDHEIPPPAPPDLESKLTGDEPARGWGLFLIENMVDRMEIHTDDTHHTVALEMRLEEDNDAGH